MHRPNIAAAHNKTIILKLFEELLIFVQQHTPSTGISLKKKALEINNPVTYNNL